MKKTVKIVTYVVPVLLSLICFLSVVINNNQAIMPVPRPIPFSGEYSSDGDNWVVFAGGDKINSFEDELIITGHFEQEIPEGYRLNFLCNHLGISVSVNGQTLYTNIRMEMHKNGRDLLPSMCGKEWSCFVCPQISPEDEVEFRIINPHKFVAKNAYTDVFRTLYIGPNIGAVMDSYLQPYINPIRIIGGILIVIALIILGATIASAFMKSNITERLLKLGLIVMTMGGYIFLNTTHLMSSNELLVVKTYGGLLCRFMVVFFIQVLMRDVLEGRKRRIAAWLLRISFFLNGILILWSTLGTLLLYDVQVYWEISQMIISPILIVLALHRVFREKKGILDSLAGVFMLIAFVLDMVWGADSAFYSAVYSKSAFIAVILFYFFIGIKNAILNYQASVKTKRLETELVEMRIAILRSQIKPHFIFNTLGVIEQFCHDEPEKAAELVHNFSLYLRGNFVELDNAVPIRITKELEHVMNYVSIEQHRFPDMQIVYDLQAEDFYLPALSVQPLVENAIKHGLMGLESGGTVKISTYEEKAAYCVRVEDDGVGFDVDAKNDKNKHTGIYNICGRIESMCGGKLVIESVPGKGTVAIISIPKERRL